LRIDYSTEPREVSTRGEIPLHPHLARQFQHIRTRGAIPLIHVAGLVTIQPASIYTHARGVSALVEFPARLNTSNRGRFRGHELLSPPVGVPVLRPIAAAAAVAIAARLGEAASPPDPAS
jgi:hypothetical protein